MTSFILEGSGMPSGQPSRSNRPAQERRGFGTKRHDAGSRASLRKPCTTPRASSNRLPWPDAEVRADGLHLRAIFQVHNDGWDEPGALLGESYKNDRLDTAHAE